MFRLFTPNAYPILLTCRLYPNLYLKPHTFVRTLILVSPQATAVAQALRALAQRHFRLRAHTSRHHTFNSTPDVFTHTHLPTAAQVPARRGLEPPRSARASHANCVLSASYAGPDASGPPGRSAPARAATWRTTTGLAAHRALPALGPARRLCPGLALHQGPARLPCGPASATAPPQ